MSVKITVKGQAELIAAMKRAGALTDSGVRRAVKLSLVNGETHMKRLISRPGPSSPGEPPGVDTGRYRSSWRNRVLASGHGLHGGEIYTDVEYGPHLERGTRRMGARPHAGPTAEWLNGELTRNVTAALKDMEGSV